jgi:hypothetical protein
MANTATRCGTALSILALLGCGTPLSGGPPSTNRPTKHVMVQFTNMTLHPSHAQVIEGGDVLWVNYAMNYTGTVVFPASTAKLFNCTDDRTIFMKTDNAYQSIPIEHDRERVITPCPLPPGEYDYELLLFEPGVSMGAMLSDPVRRMPGKITVVATPRSSTP